MRVDILELPVSVRLGVTALIHWIVLEWTLSFVAPARAGWPRLIRAGGLFPVLLLAGILFDIRVPAEFIAAAFFGMTFLWLIPFKICAFCCNRGQLVKSYDCGNKAAFALGLLLPAIVAFNENRIEQTEQDTKERHAYRDARFSVIRIQGSEMGTHAGALLARIFAKIGAVALLGWFQEYFEEAEHRFLHNLCLGWFAFCVAAIIQEVVGLAVLLTFRLKLEEGFRLPWVSQSVTEFWSRRYNLVYGTVHRDLAYAPIYEGCWIRGDEYFDRKRPSMARKAVAVMACFSASGFMHAFVMVYANSVPDWPVLYGLFFVLNGLVVVVEDWVSRAVASKAGRHKELVKGHPWIRVLYCHVVIYVLNHYLLWTEIEAAGRVDNMMEGVRPFA